MFPTGRNAETGCGTTLSFFSQSLYLSVTVTLSFLSSSKFSPIIPFQLLEKLFVFSGVSFANLMYDV